MAIRNETLGTVGVLTGSWYSNRPMFENLQQFPLLSALVSGGWVMIPLLGCSFVSLAVIVERLAWGPSRERVIPKALQSEAYRLLSTGRVDELQGICRTDQSPLARLLLVAIRNAGRPRNEVIEAMEVVGKKEAFALQKNIGVLGTIAAVSPLLGLLGTVFGMIHTFQVIQGNGTGNPGLMAGGIAEALVTTASGLAIAIPSLLSHRFFLQRAKQLIIEMEVITLSLLDEFQFAGGIATAAPSAPIAQPADAASLRIPGATSASRTR